MRSKRLTHRITRRAKGKQRVEGAVRTRVEEGSRREEVREARTGRARLQARLRDMHQARLLARPRDRQRARPQDRDSPRGPLPPSPSQHRPLVDTPEVAQAREGEGGVVAVHRLHGETLEEHSEDGMQDETTGDSLRPTPIVRGQTIGLRAHH